MHSADISSFQYSSQSSQALGSSAPTHHVSHKCKRLGSSVLHPIFLYPHRRSQFPHGCFCGLHSPPFGEARSKISRWHQGDIHTAIGIRGLPWAGSDGTHNQSMSATNGGRNHAGQWQPDWRHGSWSVFFTRLQISWRIWGYEWMLNHHWRCSEERYRCIHLTTDVCMQDAILHELSCVAAFQPGDVFSSSLIHTNVWMPSPVKTCISSAHPRPLLHQLKCPIAVFSHGYFVAAILHERLYARDAPWNPCTRILSLCLLGGYYSTCWMLHASWHTLWKQFFLKFMSCMVFTTMAYMCSGYYLQLHTPSSM
jgi:hypothetical protein